MSKSVLELLKIPSPDHALLYLPNRYDDLSQIVDSLAMAQSVATMPTPKDQKNAKDLQPKWGIKGRIASMAQSYSRKGKPMLKGKVALSCGSAIGFSILGDTKKHEEKIKAQQESNNGFVTLFGTISWLSAPIQISNGQLTGTLWLSCIPVDPSYLGAIKPVYPGNRQIEPDSVAKAMTAFYSPKHISKAVDIIKSLLPNDDISCVVDPEKLPLVIEAVHKPLNLGYARRAQEVLTALSARYSIRKSLEHKKPQGTASAINIDQSIIFELICAYPFKVTREQLTAITEISDKLNSAIPLRGLLSGDVGTGKTAVYGAVAGAVVKAGGRAAILLPNVGLATQVYKEISHWWPEINAAFITGDSKVQDASGYSLVIGTTAMLFRKMGNFDFVVIDEQQKFSRTQREQLVKLNAHMLEVTATCMPRTQALVQLGMVDTWRLTANHTNKTIHTHLLSSLNQQQALAGAKEALHRSEQVLITVALKEECEFEGLAHLTPLSDVYNRACQVFGGEHCVMLRGDMPDDEKVRVLDSMKSKTKNILIATTVVEVGVTIPGLTTLIVYDAERFGLTTLHQIRGRLVRNGGVGNCYLITNASEGNPSWTRLHALVETNDGFELAEKDLQLRGAGDLGRKSDKQSGSDDSFLIGRKVEYSVVQAIAESYF